MAASSFPPSLPQKNPDEIEHLATVIRDWSITHGLTVRPPPAVVSDDVDPLCILATTAPVTLFPSPFPRICFDQAHSLQEAYNKLYAAISQDEEFLGQIVQEIVEVDEFIAELWRVHLAVKEEGYAQDLSLGIFRSDYMAHQNLDATSPVPVIKQIEFNTIASSFGGLSSLTSHLHQYLAKGGYYTNVKESTRVAFLDLPKNTCTESLALGLRTAFEAYCKAGVKHQCCILFLVHNPERNIFDQRHLEYELQMVDPMIPVFRLPFADILVRTAVAEAPGRALLYHPPYDLALTYEVAVVYFRSGYGPNDYLNPSAWQARLQIERSKAIKCPSILTQLAGTKKVQQVLATPSSPSSSILSRFLKGDHKSIEEIEKTFTNIFPLDDSPLGLLARQIALDPERCKGYVLKPQREGGGNNSYRSAIPLLLKSLPESHWKSYILMEIITPPPAYNTILRNGKLEAGPVICELGAYGVCLWNHASKQILFNQKAGYLLRTKGDRSEEGGVAAGFGAMDSCLLV